MDVVIVLLIAGGAAAWWLGRRGGTATADPPAAPARRRTERAQPAAALPRSTSNPAKLRRAASGTARWVPLGEPIEVRSWTLPGGVYVGGRLDAVHGPYAAEPALIDPGLAADARRPDHAGRHMGYWPSYSEIPASSRAAHLEWLSGGRPGGAYIGYVFLFFYGIERRVLIDAPKNELARAEVPALVAEVERLLVLYGDNGSFSSYASGFVATARLAHGLAGADQAPVATSRGWEVPLDVKLAVGSRAADGRPIPADWALAWALSHPETRVRTPALRCPDEFAELFSARYADRHGDGLVVKPGKRMLRLDYRPASASFGGSVSVDAVGVPDVTGLKTPLKALVDLVDSVTDDLDAFSRHVGRHDERDSPRATALLPQELARQRPNPAADVVAEVAREAPAPLASANVRAVLGDTAERLPKRDAAAAASLLAARGIGVEPDVRFGPINFSHHDEAVVWSDDEAGADPGGSFAAATVLLHLGVTVSASDGSVTTAEEEHLEATLERSLDLTEAGRRRLRAHLRWLLSTRPGIAGVKTRVGALDAGERALIGRYLLAVAGADGHVSPKEIDALKRLYRLLGLEPEAVHGDLHDLAASGPARVMKRDPDPGDYALPRDVVLDPERLSEVMTSTRQVSAVLTSVFADDEPAAPEEPPEAPQPEDAIAGLDPAHTRLLRRLATQPRWDRTELDEVASEAGLLGAGAVETINEAAFEASGAPLMEGDDPVELDGDVLKEMLGA